MYTTQRHIYHILSTVLFLLLAGCASERQGPVANVYHNIAARYNAYFLASERMDEVEDALEKAQELNFNKLLYIFPEVDSNTVNSVKPQLEDVLKKSSIAIDRHKHSKWVDDSYILVGKARFYGGEFEHAVETFKYVNVNSEDDAARHLALINLMRTFTDHQELNNAKAVADYLRKENLDKENLRQFRLVQAHYFKQREDWSRMAEALAEAAPATAKRDGRARLYFVLGQVYQQMGQNQLAYESFEKSLKSNPSYELSFYSRLNMAQVFDLNEEQDEKQIRKYFSRLLRDKKNREYRDKIYYEIGNFEARQGNIEAAINNYQKSVQASINNTRQKSYAYLRLAEVYYETLENYPLAKAYYDSTVANLPDDEPYYADVHKRQEVLTQLVDNLNTIQLQDSLLQLVQRDSLSLQAFLTVVAEQEQEERERLAQLERQQTLNQVNVRPGFNTVQDNFGVSGNQGQNGEWYFYNQNLVGIGQAEFIKQWGERPLQDYWRLRSRSQRENTNVVTQDQQRENFDPAPTPIVNTSEQIANRVQELYASLPLSVEAQASARSDIETAYFQLGKLYNYELEEPVRSINSFDTLLQRFPSSEYKPEVLYQLYLLHQERDEQLAAQYKEELIRDFPNTTFAKVAENPRYHEESDRATALLKQAYAEAYQLYEQEAYKKADSILQANLRQHPENSFSDQLRLLQILITGQTDGVDRYRFQLGQFIDNTQDERLRRYAEELLQASHDFTQSSSSREGTRYSEDFNQPHYFILIYENEKKLADALIKAVDSFNLNNQADAGLKATNLKLNNNTAMVYVSQFPDRAASVLYFRAFERSLPLPEEAKNVKPQYFVITRDNFQILYDTRDVNNYVRFFNKFYN